MKKNLLENGFSEGKIKKIYPVVKFPKHEAGKEQINEENRFKLLYAGQVIRGKGIDLLLNALTHIKSRIILKIVGRGNDEGFIKALIQELNIGNMVDYHGFSSNMDSEYKWADAVVVPSRWQEPFGLIGVEAFARKLPVIGFDVGGISEWLKDGVNGFLVEHGNCEKLAEAIDVLAQDKVKCREYGRNGFDFVVEQCSKKAFLEQFYQVLGGVNV